ncbi:MAG: hypothetical protein ACMG51_07530 [Ginsengibacter sp.]
MNGLTAKGISTTDAAKQFDSLDTNKTGKLTQTDIEAGIKAGKMAPGGQPPAGAKPSTGERPHGGEHGAGGASSASSTTYDKKDLNQNNTVSAAEEMIYDLKHPDQATSSNTTQLTSSPNIGANINVMA